jgi:hypothetical protein
MLNNFVSQVKYSINNYNKVLIKNGGFLLILLNIFKQVLFASRNRHLFTICH